MLDRALVEPVDLELEPVEVEVEQEMALEQASCVVGQAAGGGRSHAGPLGKADRMLLLGAYCCLAPFAPWAAPALGWALLIGLALTTANRLRATRRELAR